MLPFKVGLRRAGARMLTICSRILEQLVGRRRYRRQRHGARHNGKVLDEAV